MKTSLYPPSPANVPADLVKVSASYQTRVIYVLLGIILFVALFLGLIAFSAYLVYWSITYDMGEVNRITVLLKLGAIAIAVMFFIFTLKFLFKKNKYQNPTDVELKEKDHPELFAFIRNICKETGAPFPKKVVVNEQINAAVYYDNPILSMFLPIRKNLLIGLGLVNSLNLTEFKAVLAHEFGHFSQRSMKLGSYVYMANRIIHDMVYNRDRWDEMLDGWSRSDFRIAIFAWILKGIIWLIRQLLALVYKGINLLHASLSRQMEFHADLVAVSITGSDQIVNGLSKIMRSSQAMNLAMGHLSNAADHKLYSSNLFYHQAHAEAHLAEQAKKTADESNTDSRGIPMIFSPDDLDIPDMYASHPPNFDREVNAKEHYIEGITDERSPWILFSDADGLKELITKKIYANSPVKPNVDEFSSAEEVQQFIHAEMAETSFDERYCGAYDSRYIHPYPLAQADQLISALAIDTEEKIKASYQQLVSVTLPIETAKRATLQKEWTDVYQFAAQGGKAKTFNFRGAERPAEAAEATIEALRTELNDQYDGWFKEFDEQMFVLHLAMSKTLNPDVQADYLERCRFQNAISEMNQRVEQAELILEQTVQGAIEQGELSDGDINHFNSRLNDSRSIVDQILKNAEAVTIPKMQYVEAKPLREFIFEGQLILGGERLLSDSWIHRYSEQLSVIKTRLSRLYFKSIGNVVRLQTEISDAYLKP